MEMQKCTGKAYESPPFQLLNYKNAICIQTLVDQGSSLITFLDKIINIWALKLEGSVGIVSDWKMGH